MSDARVDLLSEVRIRDALGARPFRYFPQVESTNDIARQWALDGTPAGSVVVADEQVAGRGRFGRAWVAAPGTALLMSVVLRPRVTRLPRLTIVGALAVAETIESLMPDHKGLISLKWPNDVLLSGRKVSGILSEALWDGETLIAVILGIGLNVRVDFAGTELVERATSIEPTLHIPVDRAALLAELLRRIDYWTVRIMDPALIEAWRNRLTTIGQRVTAQGQDTTFSGQAVAVDDDGALLIRADDSTIYRVIAGEVTLAES